MYEKEAAKKKVKIQLGNPFDMNGAQLVEALLVARMEVAIGKPANIYIYNQNGDPMLCQAFGTKAPHFEEAVDYSTRGGNLEMGEKHFGVGQYWLKNNWWLDKAEYLNPEPLKVKRQ